MENGNTPQEDDNLRASSLIAKGFNFVSDNFFHLLPLILLISLPALVGHIIKFTNDNDLATSIALAPFDILSLFVSIVLSLIVTSYVFHMVRHNLRLPFIEAVEFGLSKTKLLLPVVLLSSLYILGGLVLFIIPGLLFAFWYMFSSVVKLDNESMGAKDAMNRSKELFKKNSSRILNLVLLTIVLFIPVGIVSLILSAVLGGVSTLAASITTEVLSNAFSMIPQVAFTFLYIAISSKEKTAHSNTSAGANQTT